MRNRLKTFILATAGLAAVFPLAATLAGQGRGAAAGNLPRTADGKPDLNGIWEANNTANWDLQDHNAKPGPVIALGAAFSIPAGMGVVDGGEIPYQPAALAKKRENGENWLRMDPEVKCYMPGIPRANYMPYPFQIVQTPTHILFAYEFANAARTVFVNGKEEPPVDTWMGWSNARWEGDTLVIKVNGFNDQTWFDRAGNYHSSDLVVTERLSLATRDIMNYEATIEDAKTFTRPWKISMPIYRRVDKQMRLLEYKCVEFTEELLYGHLRKPTTN